MTLAYQPADTSALDGPEVWEVDKESAELLASILTQKSATSTDALLPKLRDLQLEEPLLRTDPKMDMLKRFERNKVSINTEGIQPFPLDIEKDQGLEWSQHSLQLPTTMDQRVVDEKLPVDQETGLILREAYAGPYFDFQDWFDKEYQRKVSVVLRFASHPANNYSPGRRQFPHQCFHFHHRSVPVDCRRQLQRLTSHLLPKTHPDKRHSRCKKLSESGITWTWKTT